MNKQRRQLVLLGALGVVLVLVVLWQMKSGSSTPRSTSAPARANTSARRAAAAAQSAALTEDVRLAALDAPRPAPLDGGRNLFRFGMAPPPPASETMSQGGGPIGPGGMPGLPGESPGASGPIGPPPPPPIALKYIGVVSGSSTGGKIAVLSDGKFVFHGREGDIIEGRYRLVRIGEESVQLEYIDGRGRQTVRLSGS